MKINFLHYLLYVVRKSITNRRGSCFLLIRCYIFLFPVTPYMASPIIDVNNLSTKSLRQMKIVLQEIKKWNIRNQGLVCNTEHIYIIPFHNCQEWTIFLEEWRSFDNYWILQSISSSLSDNCWMETDWEMSPPNTHWQRRGRWRSAGDCYWGRITE